MASRELEARIEELETRESFHDYTLESLNQTIIEQQREIDYLKKMVSLLVNKFKNSDLEEPRMDSIIDEKPPHY